MYTHAYMFSHMNKSCQVYGLIGSKWLHATRGTHE